jgi:hypothetical protein
VTFTAGRLWTAVSTTGSGTHVFAQMLLSFAIFFQLRFASRALGSLYKINVMNRSKSKAQQQHEGRANFQVSLSRLHTRRNRTFRLARRSASSRRWRASSSSFSRCESIFKEEALLWLVYGMYNALCLDRCWGGDRLVSMSVPLARYPERFFESRIKISFAIHSLSLFDTAPRSFCAVITESVDTNAFFVRCVEWSGQSFKE